MATRDVLPGAVHVLRLRFMRFYINTINVKMNLQQSGGTSQNSALTLTSRKNGFLALKSAPYRPYLLNNGKRNKKQKKRGLRPRCCAVRPHSEKKRSSTKKLDSSSSRHSLAENRNKHRSAPKRKAEDATHLLLIIYPRCEASS
ncbi:hypothetical protein DPX16_19419 [Anabarilius grahami]|uniref:Uncharacterized protein n=1 Tax=Anabarilius grahami TaxID=495550 RepID=A0A3N0Z0C6_ANAGA|nr:hypothetical protein DPX16_19419 [Anabarilius grahami]